MPETHDSKPFTFARGPLIVHCESLFWHPQRYPGRRVSGRPPLTEPAAPRELEQPYRKGHGRVFRIPLTRRAVVIGYWEPSDAPILLEEESDALLEAVEGAHIPGITAVDIADWARARDWSWFELLVRRLRALLGLQAAAEPSPRAVAPPFEYEDTWVIVPWHDTGRVIDLDDARTAAIPPAREQGA